METLQDFLNELNSANPDKDKIVAWIRDNGVEHLSAAQKDEFLQAILPAKFSAGHDCTPLGFEETSKIRLTLEAMQKLMGEGKITPEQLKDFLTYCPEGQNHSIMSTIALNQYAGEFKLKHINDADTRAKLENNLQDLRATMEVLAQTDKDVLKDVINQTDKRGYSFAKLWEKSADELKNSASLSSFQQAIDAARNAPETLSVDGNTAPGTLEVSGNTAPETLEVGGNTAPEAPQPNNPQPNPATDMPEKTADVDANGQKDDLRKINDFKFERVKEQDIVELMLNQWFLGSINWLMEHSFKLADWALAKLDKMIEKSPRKNKIDALPVNGQAIDFMNDISFASTQSARNMFTENQDSFAAYYHMIDDNKGRPFEQWVIPTIKVKEKDQNNKTVIVEKPRFNVDERFVQNVNAAYGTTPAENRAFERRLKANAAQAIHESAHFKRLTQLAGYAATVQYLAQHPDGPYDDTAKAAVMNKTLENIETLQTAAFNSAMLAKIEYCHANGITGETLSETQQKEVDKLAAEKYADYLVSAANDTDKLRHRLGDYYNAATQEEKTDYLTKINSLNENLKKSLSVEASFTGSSPEHLRQLPQKPESLLAVAADENRRDEFNARFLRNLSADTLTSSLYADKEISTKRKEMFRQEVGQKLPMAATRFKRSGVVKVTKKATQFIKDKLNRGGRS